MEDNIKLIIDPNIDINRMQAKSLEEQEFLGLLNEVGKQGVIDLAINLSPGRDFSEDPFEVAKDVLCGLYANGGEERLFNQMVVNRVSPSCNPQDRVSIDY